MKRAAWLGAALVLACGCGTAPGDTDVSELRDGGPDARPEVILDGGGEPATPPDGASKCPQGACNYQTGAGCPAATPACLPLSDGNGGVAPACGPAGAGMSGAACAQVSDCAAGYFCVEQTCHKLCC